MMRDEYTCPNGCDLRGEPIPQEYINAGHYGTKTHYSRMIGIDGGYVGIYDGVIAWYCPDCGLTWPRAGWENDPRVQMYVREANVCGAI